MKYFSYSAYHEVQQNILNLQTKDKEMLKQSNNSKYDKSLGF